MEQITEIYGIPAIAAMCYILIEFFKVLLPQDKKSKAIYPLASAFIGMLLGIALYFADSEAMIADTIGGALVMGFVSGLSATGGNQIIKKLSRKQMVNNGNNSSGRYYITGDKHRDFSSVIKFCKNNHLRSEDTIIVLGDSGFNYYGDERDDALKARVSALNVKMLLIHGNKENRPNNISTYGIRTFLGGTVYYEPKYPNLLFAKDAEIYNFNGKEFMVIGGAHSVDKLKCLEEGLPYWEDEMPDQTIKDKVEAQLAKRQSKIYGFLTHTCPLSYIPTEMLVSTQRSAGNITRNNLFGFKKRRYSGKKNYPLDINRSTEEWLETIKSNTSFSEWYCGHYHIDKELGGIKMMKSEILPFCVEGDV